MTLRGFGNRTNSVVACVANGGMVGGKMGIDSSDDWANVCGQFVLLEHSLHRWTFGSADFRSAEITYGRSNAKDTVKHRVYADTPSMHVRNYRADTARDIFQSAAGDYKTGWFLLSGSLTP